MSAQTHIEFLKRMARLDAIAKAAGKSALGKSALAFAYTEKGAAYDAETHQATFVISDASVDRDKDILFPDGVDLTDYDKNPVVLYQHDSHGDSLPVGHAVRTWVDSGRVLSTVQFNQTNALAKEVEAAVAAGDLRACSVGFIGVKCEQNSNRPTRWGGFGQDIKEWILLEWSIVKIPSNPNAVLDRKAFDAFLESAMSTISLTPADPSAVVNKDGDAGAGLMGQIATAHKEAMGHLKACKDMHDSLKEMHKAHKDNFDAYQKGHKDMASVHSGLVEDQKALHKSHKDLHDVLGGHIGKMESAVKALTDSMGLATAVGSAQASVNPELVKKLGEAEAVLNDAKATVDAKVAAAFEVKRLQKLIAKSGRVLSGAHRDALTKAMEKMDHAKEHIAGIIKAADAAETDDDEPDADDEDKAGDTDAVKAEKKARREAKAAARAEKKSAAQKAADETFVAEQQKLAEAGDEKAKAFIADFEKALAAASKIEMDRANGKTNFAAA